MNSLGKNQETHAEMSLSEAINFWSGRLVVAIGAGEFRDEVNLMISTLTRDSYEAGKSDGKVRKK
jgi:hypothetical protein